MLLQSSYSYRHYHIARIYRTAFYLDAFENFKKAFQPDPDMVAEEFPKSRDISELPASFNDAVKGVASRTLDVINKTGGKRVRIDYDTSIGDMTYTSIKNTLPMMKELASILHTEMDLSYTAVSGYKDPIAFTKVPEIPNDMKTTEEYITKNDVDEKADVALMAEQEINDALARADTEKKAMEVFEQSLSVVDGGVAKDDRTLRIFFPDMGAAALARRDWKMGSPISEVPSSIFTANIQNDPLVKSDKLAVILCPLSSETDYVKRVLDMCVEADIPCVLINPQLINMDQGFGVRARNLRKTLLNTFTTSYKLKTTKFGAIVREWPLGFSVWNEDSSTEDGYRLLETYREDPPRELVDELYDAANPENPDAKVSEPSVAKTVAKEIFSFFQGLSKI